MKKRNIFTMAVLLALALPLFGQNTSTGLFQGTWYEVPISQLGMAIMSNSYIRVEGFVFSGDNYSAFRIEGRGVLGMARPISISEGKFSVNSKNQTIVLIDAFGDRSMLRYVFIDNNKTLRLRRDDGFTATFYKED